MRAAVGLEARAFALRARLYLTRTQVEEMTRNGLTVANHTSSHGNLRCLPRDEQRRELLEAENGVEDLGVHPSLAFPFGEFNQDTIEGARELGYRSLMLVGGVNRELDYDAVGRVPAWAPSRAGFFAELEVVAPVHDWLRRRWH
jgi:peptidoglycan/xylan/chitin deacetylase (PgdA/CDA1 family)